MRVPIVYDGSLGLLCTVGSKKEVTFLQEMRPPYRTIQGVKDLTIFEVTSLSGYTEVSKIKSVKPQGYCLNDEQIDPVNIL